MLSAKGLKTEESAFLSWQVTFSDGSVKSGHDGLSYSRELGTSKQRVGIVEFALTDGEDGVPVSFKVDPEKRFFYRMRVQVLPFSEYMFPHSRRYYICGYRERKSDSKMKVVLYVVDTEGNVKKYNSFDKSAGLSEPNWNLEGELV
jgi:hypothetical protein